MARARSLVMIAGALALFPVGFVAAMIIRATIVRPLVRALPELFSEDVRDAGPPAHPRVQLVASHPLEPAEASEDRHSYVLDLTGEEAPSIVYPLLNQVRIVPFYENGMPAGFRIVAIQPGSIYRRLGIENGDVIRRINGQPLDSPEKALELYSKLRDEKWIDVELERGGKPVVRVYRVD